MTNILEAFEARLTGRYGFAPCDVRSAVADLREILEPMTERVCRKFLGTCPENESDRDELAGILFAELCPPANLVADIEWEWDDEQRMWDGRQVDRYTFSIEPTEAGFFVLSTRKLDGGWCKRETHQTLAGAKQEAKRLAEARQ